MEKLARYITEIGLKHDRRNSLSQFNCTEFLLVLFQLHFSCMSQKLGRYGPAMISTSAISTNTFFFYPGHWFSFTLDNPITLSRNLVRIEHSYANKILLKYLYKTLFGGQHHCCSNHTKKNNFVKNQTRN